MGATFEPAGDIDDVVREAVKDQIREVAEGIAQEAQANISFPGARSGPVTVEESDRGFTVAMQGPFAHIEEWGSINNGPQAPMRRAAYASGHEFNEE